jgi:hypothetical protein
MYLCYIDETGISGNNGNTSHFVLAGIAIPIYHWKTCDKEINDVKAKYHLQDKEIHTGWILRKYSYQENIPNFHLLSLTQRVIEVNKLYKMDLLLTHRTRKAKSIKQVKKNFKHIEPYIHLTYKERNAFAKEVAETIGKWGFARLFAECINTIHFVPERANNQSIDEQAFMQVVSRFQHYLEFKSKDKDKIHGLLIHDNNPTVAKRHTLLMKDFHKRGTFWNKIPNIIETPLFVDSTLTSMVQIADICAYSLRRYIENKEDELFNEIFKRAHRIGDTTVGIRHFNILDCDCLICKNHDYSDIK